MPPSTRSVGIVDAGVGLGRFDEVGAAVRDAFEHRAHDLGASGAAGEPEQRAARAVVPLRRAEPERRGHEHDAAGVGRTAPRSSCDSRGDRDEPEVVAQPLHVGARREHDRFDAPRDAHRSRARRRSGTCRARPRVVEARAASSPSTRSSMPPVPNVILASPRRTQPWPTSDACWSPSEAGDRRRAGQRGRVADDAGRVDDRRQHRAGMPSTSSVRVVPARVIGARLQPGDRGVGRVGHVRRALGERPRDPRVDGAEAQVAVAAGIESWSSSHCTLVADWFGATRKPSARSARHAPTVRRSCQPSPGPTGSPVARSHTIVDAALVGDADRVDRARRVERGARERRGTCAAIARRVELDEAVGGRVGQQLSRDFDARTCASARTTAARTLLVPTSTTSTLRFVIGSRPGEIAERARQAELAGVEDAVRVERVLHRTAARRSPRRARRRRTGRG